VVHFGSPEIFFSMASDVHEKQITVLLGKSTTARRMASSDWPESTSLYLNLTQRRDNKLAMGPDDAEKSQQPLHCNVPAVHMLYNQTHSAEHAYGDGPASSVLTESAKADMASSGRRTSGAPRRGWWECRLGCGWVWSMPDDGHTSYERCVRAATNAPKLHRHLQTNERPLGRRGAMTCRTHVSLMR
jgi:hypothetical protein